MKVLRNLGIVASVVGAGITWYGYSKFDEANGMVKALTQGDSLFGGNSSSSINIWSGHADDYKLMLIIGAVILVVGIICFIAGLTSSSGKKDEGAPIIETKVENTDMTGRLEKLEELKEKGLISQEEYEEKRKELISAL